MSIHPEDDAWLARSGLVDAEVDLDALRLHTSGPPSWYLSIVRRNAITLGDHVWSREAERFRDRRLLVHELVHVAQYRRIGRVRFVARYLLDLAKAGFRYSKELPLEVPAYARAEQARQLLEAGQPAAGDIQGGDV